MTDTSFPRLPAGFVFGASTASYQIEGAVDADGRGRSVWDTFCQRPGAIRDGQDGRYATDHYHRWREDVALMAELGLDAYRFSLAWPRIQPTGSGPVNRAGLDFYSRLVDALLEAGITPAATLFHWDTPQRLQDGGGWRERDTAERFAEYAAIVGAELGDRVGMWMPVNEPSMVTLFGHALGNHAPGLELGFEALPVAHHLLLGHGLAVQALRAAGCTNIGTASNHAMAYPATDSPADAEATEIYQALVGWTFSDPILHGCYPDEMIAAAMPGPVDDDLQIISAPLDFFGVNSYEPVRVSAEAPGPNTASDIAEGAVMPEGLPFFPSSLPGYPKTDFGWSVVPDALREILHAFADRYGDALPPLMITESGCSIHDPDPDARGRVPDPRRIAYHDGYLRAVACAIEEGADVRGYFAWSLLDNFEWAAGYRERFGLVHVDYESFARTRKDSFHWYRELIAAHPR